MLKKKKISRKSRDKNLSLVDVVSIEEMTKEQLEQHVNRLRKELEKERQERNYFILERDKISTFWEIAKKQLEDRTSELRIRDHEQEKAEERHQVELNIYRQKLKQLMVQRQVDEFDFKSDLINALNTSEDNFMEQGSIALEANKQLKATNRQKDVENEQLIHNMKLLYEEQIHKLRQDFEHQLDDERRRGDEKLKNLYENMELQRKMELYETEERKNNQLDMHSKTHEKAFADIKSYYNDITLNNLTLINSLKEQLADARKKYDVIEKKNAGFRARLKCQEDELSDLKNENKTSLYSLNKYKHDAENLKARKADLKRTSRQLKILSLDYEVLTQRLKFVENERDELYEKFAEAIQDVQRKCGLKNAALEQKLNTLVEKLEVSEIQLTNMISTQHLDSNAVAEQQTRIKETLDAKNDEITGLQFELAKVFKTHKDLISTLRSKFDIYGISLDDLNLPLVRKALSTQVLVMEGTKGFSTEE